MNVDQYKKDSNQRELLLETKTAIPENCTIRQRGSAKTIDSVVYAIAKQQQQYRHGAPSRSKRHAKGRLTITY